MPQKTEPFDTIGEEITARLHKALDRNCSEEELAGIERELLLHTMLMEEMEDDRSDKD